MECTCPPSKICDLCSPLPRVASLGVTEEEEREAEAEREEEERRRQAEEEARQERKRKWEEAKEERRKKREEGKTRQRLNLSRKQNARV